MLDSSSRRCEVNQAWVIVIIALNLGTSKLLGWWFIQSGGLWEKKEGKKTNKKNWGGGGSRLHREERSRWQRRQVNKYSRRFYNRDMQRKQKKRSWEISFEKVFWCIATTSHFFHQEEWKWPLIPETSPILAFWKEQYAISFDIYISLHWNRLPSSLQVQQQAPSKFNGYNCNITATLLDKIILQPEELCGAIENTHKNEPFRDTTCVLNARTITLEKLLYYLVTLTLSPLAANWFSSSYFLWGGKKNTQ